MARKKNPAPIKINPKEQGSLRAIAKREGAIKKNGEINRTWARKKMANPRTTASTKKKLNFFLNLSK